MRKTFSREGKGQIFLKAGNLGHPYFHLLGIFFRSLFNKPWLNSKLRDRWSNSETQPPWQGCQIRIETFQFDLLSG